MKTLYFYVFYFKTVIGSYKTARISVHIRHLFIEAECLLIGCISYISYTKNTKKSLVFFLNTKDTKIPSFHSNLDSKNTYFRILRNTCYSFRMKKISHIFNTKFTI